MTSNANEYIPGEYFRRYQEKITRLKNTLTEDEPHETTELNDETRDENAAFEYVLAKPNAKSKRQLASKANAPSKKQKKWSWSAELVEKLLRYCKEFKTQCEYRGIDFEADLQSMYTEIRLCMSTEDSAEFGPKDAGESVKNLKDMDEDEQELFMKARDAAKKNIRKGYERVKEKIKSIRQDYRTAVNKGTRSGSGKIIQENYDLLTDIWGGSPATTALPFGVDGVENEAEKVEVDVLNVSNNVSDDDDAEPQEQNKGISLSCYFCHLFRVDVQLND